MARFIMNKLTEEYGIGVNLHPKPLEDFNGSGAHVNFSTLTM